MHPLRKRKNRSDSACSQYGTEEDEPSTSEPRNKACPANKIDEKEQSIVISDSDSLELEEEGISQKKKPLHRKTLSAKRKIARMTEEEQLALAVRISQQEQANHVKHRQEEDELLRKAIEESLHSCKSPDKSTDVAVHELTKEASSSEDDIAIDEQHKEHLSQQSQILGQDSPQNPKVLLKRLSQDIVESSSVILSPNCKDPLPCTESCKASSLSQSISNDFDCMSPSKASLSPVFPVKSPYAHKILPCRLFQDRSPSGVKLSEGIEDLPLHCSESTPLDSSSLISVSNKSELTEDTNSLPNVGVCLKGSSIGNTSVNNRDALSKHTCQSSAYKFAKKDQNDSSVHYYWGIPFCPNGEDPNAYTQVILCQLEVYEKSLKKSQRQLLKKTEYGEPIDLAASSENNEHAKDNQGSLSQEDTEEIIEGGDQQKPHQSEMEPEEESDSSDIQPAPSKRLKATCSQFQEDDHSCQSEGQMESQSNEPCTEMLPSKCEGVAPEVLEESPISPADVRKELSIENTQEESVCPETQLGSEIQSNDQENQPDLTETASLSSQDSCLNVPPPKLMACREPALSPDVECPMCGCRFSQPQIERHAAYCDGDKDEPQMAVLRPRNRQSGNTYNGSCDSAASSDSGKLENCYLCKSLVPIKDYQTHVDKCLQSATLEAQGTQRLKSSKETAERKGRLLSMLEQSESISADENNSALDFSGMSPPREEHADHLSINDSPIRSFVSISEATDCLVDFKKQFRCLPTHQSNKKRPKQRRRGKRKM